MKSMNKKQILVAVIASAIVAIAGGVVLYPQQTVANTSQEGSTDFSALIAEDPIIMKKGESKTIPVEIYAAKEKSLNLKIGLSEGGKELGFQLNEEEKLPDGISASVDKKVEKFQAEKEKGIDNRDTIYVSITTSPTVKAGTYTLALTMVRDDGAYVSQYFRVVVQE